MGRFFVRSLLRVAIGLHQHKPGGFLLLLKHLEGGDARLEHALAGVLDRHPLERAPRATAPGHEQPT